MQSTFDSQLEEVFSSHNKKTGKYDNEFEFDYLIERYWRFQDYIEWKERMDKESKQYYKSLLDDILKTDCSLTHI